MKITREIWDKKNMDAVKFMQSRKGIKKVLIEISTQHPLKDGEFPALEYESRLLEGIRLMKKAQDEGYAAELYTGASRHREGNVDDVVSLAQAGERFLLEHGVSADILHTTDLIERYKGPQTLWPGVYNSSDEAFVSSSYFKDENFGQLWCVVGPAQLHRKALSYIWFGVVPLMYSVPVLETYHSYVREAFEIIPNVLSVDPSMQEADSPYAKLSRELRMVKE
jgi:hypothetical protein